MSGIENKIENRVIRKTMNIEEEEEVVQQLFSPFPSSKSSPRCSKECSKGGCTATRGFGMMMDGFCDDRVLK